MHQSAAKKPQLQLMRDSSHVMHHVTQSASLTNQHLSKSDTRQQTSRHSIASILCLLPTMSGQLKYSNRCQVSPRFQLQQLQIMSYQYHLRRGCLRRNVFLRWYSSSCLVSGPPLHSECVRCETSSRLRQTDTWRLRRCWDCQQYSHCQQVVVAPNERHVFYLQKIKTIRWFHALQT